MRGLVYKKQGHPDVVCAIPRRLEMAQEKGLLIVAHATHKLKERHHKKRSF